MNLCRAEAGSNGAVALGALRVPLPAGAAGREVILGFRPESLELSTDGLEARVDVVEELGADAYVFCRTQLGGGEETTLVARVDVRRVPARGDTVALRPVDEDVHVFDAESGARLPR